MIQVPVAALFAFATAQATGDETPALGAEFVNERGELGILGFGPLLRGRAFDFHSR